jgi:flagellar biosynthesis chaperone FliJ
VTHHEKDRGMHAVARVREVRERDSRVGLLQATTNVRMREEQLTERRAALDEAMTRSVDTLDGFVTSRHLLAATAVSVREAETRLDAGRTVAVEAHHRWQADKSRLRAIEHLLEERALARAEEADRAERRETDDIVNRLHARTHGAPA